MVYTLLTLALIVPFGAHSDVYPSPLPGQGDFHILQFPRDRVEYPIDEPDRIPAWDSRYLHQSGEGEFVRHSIDTLTQDKLPVIKSNVSTISILDGEVFKKNGWNLAPEYNPDIYNVGLIDGEPHRVTFYTDVDSISFMVKVGESYDFIIEWGEKMCYQRLVGKRYVPAAVFDEEYVNERKGKIFYDIPDVYELVNVAIALTTFGRDNPNYIYQKSDYYRGVIDWFDEYSEHRLIRALDSVLTNTPGYYASLKMNGYSFSFDEDGEIRRSAVYDRTGFRGQSANTLLPFLEDMQSFARETNFLDFFKRNSQFYNELITFYRDSLDVPEMQRWLERNFPGSSEYDTYNIIFSPLVSYNQSSTWFESNGFRELQPHVNFPYRQDVQNLLPISTRSEYIDRGTIVFTELNHGYINPEAEKYGSSTGDAVSNRHAWVDSTKPENYYGGQAVFTEYMNWGLLSLRIVDYAPDHEQEKLISRIEQTMVKGRSFVAFREFNRFLVDLYRNRGEGTTVAELYPQIIGWFEKNNQ